jgi:hypothetical protein
MVLEDIDHIMRQIEALVPEGRLNRQGMRIWREILNNIRVALQNALAGINAGNQAQATANTALTLANNNLVQINQNTANITVLRIDLTAHEALGAGAGVLGHVSQGAAPPAGVVAAPGAAPAAYNAAHSQSLVDAINELNTRFAALDASLRGTGIIA